MKTINRRNLIKASLLGSGGLLCRPLFSQTSIEAPFYVFVHCDGGWDPTMVFDNHIGNNVVAAEGGAFPRQAGNMTHISHSSRPSVDSFFDAYNPNTAIINGISTGSLSKEKAIQNMLGTLPSGLRKPVDWMTYYAANMNPLVNMPHVVIDGPYMPGQYQSSTVYLTSEMLANHTNLIPNAETIGSEGEAALSEFYTARHTAAVGAVNGKSLDYEKLRAISAAHTREATVASIINTVSTNLGPQGSDSDFLRAGKIALESFSSGYSQCASLRSGGLDAWDTTYDHFNRQSALYESLFADLKALIEYAATKSVGDTTLDQRLVLIVTSERGRNPKLNANQGKGPWPFSSALVWGGIVNGGQTLVGTDAALRGNIVNPLIGTKAGGTGDVYISMKNIMAALYSSSGLSTSKILKGHQPLIPMMVTES